MNAEPTTTEERPSPTYDPLVEFAKWCLAQPGMMVPRCPAGGMSRAGGCSGLILCQQGQFQAEIWLCDPGAEIPDHRHPNVDQIQVYLSGEVYLRKNGVPQVTPEGLQELPDGTSNANGLSLRVTPEDTHGGTIGPMGGAFVNFQHWLAGSPKGVHLDWEGEPMDEDHAVAILGQENPVVVVCDDFSPEFKLVREMALTSSYGTAQFQGHSYRGVGLDRVPDLTHLVSVAMGFPVEIKLHYFRLGTPGNEPTTFIHADRNCAEFAGILYLNRPDQCRGGTAFWKHRGMNRQTMPIGRAPAFYGALDEEGQSVGRWEQTQLVEMKANRFIAYPTKFFHSRWPQDGWGDSVEDGRLVYTCFFDKV